jgi:gluconate 2-dehydrogenase subunit 3-like protein
VPDAERPLTFPLTRRQVLRYGAWSAAALVPAWRAVAGLDVGGGAAPALQFFLSSDEATLLDAIVSRIIPSDTQPGAHEIGVAAYIQGLLSALPAADANCDRRRGAADFTAILLRRGGAVEDGCVAADVNGDGAIDEADASSAVLALFEAQPVFAGGPFSGRQPFGDFETGHISDTFPPNSFENFLPLNRLQRLAWAVRLNGAGAVPEVAGNPLATELPDVDLRRRYRQGLRTIDDTSRIRYGIPFVVLDPARQDEVLKDADADFVNLLTAHTIEGMLSAPEYGGNRDRLGWQLIGFDGDSQPLGYTLGFDEATQQYIERPDKPNSGPNPDEDCSGFSQKVTAFVRTIASAEETKPNQIFRTPFCFEVST